MTSEEGLGRTAAATLAERRFGPSELEISEEDFAAFVGPNGSAYVNYLRKCKEAGRLKSGFIWSAFFFTSIWLAYRRFYGGLVWYLIASLIPGVTLVAGVYVALRGRAMLLRRAAESVYVADARSLTGAERHAFLAKKGNRSRISATLIFLLWTILLLLISGISAVENAKELADKSGTGREMTEQSVR